MEPVIILDPSPVSVVPCGLAFEPVFWKTKVKPMTVAEDRLEPHRTV